MFKMKKRDWVRLNYIVPLRIIFPEKGFLKQVIGRKAKLFVKIVFRKKFRDPPVWPPLPLDPPLAVSFLPLYFFVTISLWLKFQAYSIFGSVVMISLLYKSSKQIHDQSQLLSIRKSCEIRSKLKIKNSLIINL